jgi:DNA-binding PadR family transcriptional regulator
MTTEPSTLYKLMILYTLYASEFPLTNSQVCEFILDKGYTTYFSVQAAISDLIEAQFISVKQQNNSSYYRLTAAGKETLEAFSTSISDGIKEDIHAYLEDKHYALRLKNEITASYLPKKNQEFEVELSLKDGKETLLTLQMTVPTEVQAELICDHWERQSSEIYNYLMTSLLAKKTVDE